MDRGSPPVHNRISLFLLFLYHSCRFPQGVQLHKPQTKLWVQLKIQASCFVQEQEWDRGGNAAVCGSSPVHSEDCP